MVFEAEQYQEMTAHKTSEGAYKSFLESVKYFLGPDILGREDELAEVEAAIVGKSPEECFHVVSELIQGHNINYYIQDEVELED
jgi:hypothetical protein